MLADPQFTYAQAVQGLRQEYIKKTVHYWLFSQEEKDTAAVALYKARPTKEELKRTPDEILEYDHAREHWYFCKRSFCKWHYQY
jgi:hypothetical protein